YIATYTCPTDTRGNQLRAPDTLAPDGAGNNGTFLYRSGSYRAMTGVGIYQDTYQGITVDTDTLGGYWYEAVAAAKGNTKYKDATGKLLNPTRSEEHTSELQSHLNLVCRLLLEKKKRQEH